MVGFNHSDDMQVLDKTAIHFDLLLSYLMLHSTYVNNKVRMDRTCKKPGMSVNKHPILGVLMYSRPVGLQ